MKVESEVIYLTPSSNFHSVKQSANYLHLCPKTLWILDHAKLFVFFWSFVLHKLLTKDYPVSVLLGLCTQASSDAGRILNTKHRISNCSDIAHAIGPHLYVQVKEQFGLMLWHRSFPSTSFLAPHLTSSAKGGRAERVIYWTHLFICQTFSSHNLWSTCWSAIPPTKKTAEVNNSHTGFTTYEADLMSWAGSFLMEASDAF